jgi:hypothetical protein
MSSVASPGTRRRRAPDQQAKSSVRKSLSWPVTFHHPQALAVDDSTLFGVLLLTFAMVQLVPEPG